MKATRDRTSQFTSSATPTSSSSQSHQSILSQPPPSRSKSPFVPSSRVSEDGGNGGYEVDKKGKARGDYLALDMESAEDGRGGEGAGGFQQMQLVEEQVGFISYQHLAEGCIRLRIGITWNLFDPRPHSADAVSLIDCFLQDNYIQSRSTAIETIESTIAELGTIFSQLAHMVAEQRETVQRIDADTTDISNNVAGAQRELLKYYASVSGNRWLMVKIFGVLIIFVSGD